MAGGVPLPPFGHLDARPVRRWCRPAGDATARGPLGQVADGRRYPVIGIESMRAIRT